MTSLSAIDFLLKAPAHLRSDIVCKTVAKTIAVIKFKTLQHAVLPPPSTQTRGCQSHTLTSALLQPFGDGASGLAHTVSQCHWSRNDVVIEGNE